MLRKQAAPSVAAKQEGGEEGWRGREEGWASMGALGTSPGPLLSCRDGTLRQKSWEVRGRGEELGMPGNGGWWDNCTFRGQAGTPALDPATVL